MFWDFKMTRRLFAVMLYRLWQNVLHLHQYWSLQGFLLTISRIGRMWRYSAGITRARSRIGLQVRVHTIGVNVHGFAEYRHMRPMQMIGSQ